jgi:hypothetical protein
MASKTPTWVWIVFGIFGFCALMLIAVVGGSIVMFRQHVHTEALPKQTALQQFERERNRFVGQQPLIQAATTGDDDRNVVVRRPPETAQRHTVKAIRVLSYDERNGQLVTVDVPIWLARWALSRGEAGRGRRRMTFGDGTVDFESGDLSFEDIERNGPGLILDATDARGAQVLVWAE